MNVCVICVFVWMDSEPPMTENESVPATYSEYPRGTTGIDVSSMSALLVTTYPDVSGIAVPYLTVAPAVAYAGIRLSVATDVPENSTDVSTSSVIT